MYKIKTDNGEISKYSTLLDHKLWHDEKWIYVGEWLEKVKGSY